MRGFVALTDYQWYSRLMALEPDEVNFWRPMDTRAFRALKPLEPLLFKLKSAHGNFIAGFGIYVGFMTMRVGQAWEWFGESNGVGSEDEMRSRVNHYALRNRGSEVGPTHEIGCILLTTPCFFPKSHFVEPPNDWQPNIVSGAGYDLEVGEGKRIWSECLERARDLHSSEALAYNLALAAGTVEFRERASRVRLGQGAFRALVTDAYSGTCAISGDHTLPALEATHIQPVTEGGPHELPNGMLMRADIHRLFDRHLVTVTPDYEFQVSERLKEEYANGRAYYALQGRELYLPDDKALRPRREYLELHRDRFLRAG